MTVIMEYHFGKKPIPAQSKQTCQHALGGTEDKYESHVRIYARRRRLW